MTPAAARNSMLALVQKSQTALGTEGEWEKGLPVDYQDCVSGGDGSSWGYTHIGPVVADHDRDAAAKTLRGLWTAEGLTVRIIREGAGGDSVTRVVGSGGPVSSIGVDMQHNGTAMDGESLCFTGTPTDSPDR